MKQSKSRRHAQILSLVMRSPSLRVAQLAEHLSVSTETVRRDLDTLTEQGLLNRTYGGAVRSTSVEPSVGERHSLFVEQRERIASAAAARVRPGGLVMIGAGSTTTRVAQRIAIEQSDLTVITHSFGVATALSVNPAIKVVMAPGAYLPSESATVGGLTLGFLSDYAPDIAILGASGMTSDGPTDALMEMSTVYGAMAAQAAETMLVADHSKFDQIFAARYAGWGQIGTLVTDEAPSGALAAALSRHKVAVVVA